MGAIAVLSDHDYKNVNGPINIKAAVNANDAVRKVDAENASKLASGTVPDARFPATLPALSGANLTALNASNLGSGTVPDARFPATLPALSGANLTALNASNLGSGTVPNARFPATLPAANGSALTALNATNLGSGTVPTARFPSKSIAQMVVNQSTATATSTTTIPYDGTIPQSTEGAAFSALDTSITPTNSSSQLLVRCVMNLGNGGGGSRTGAVAVFRDSGANAVAAGVVDLYTSGASAVLVVEFYISASSTSATTFKIRFGNDTTATVYVNRSNGQSSLFGGTMTSSLTITEILP